MTNIGKIIRLSSIEKKQMGQTEGNGRLKDEFYSLKTPNDFKLQPGKITRIFSSKQEPAGGSYGSGGSYEAPAEFRCSSSIKMPLQRNSWQKHFGVKRAIVVNPLVYIKLGNGERLGEPFIRYPFKLLNLSKGEALKIWKTEKGQSVETAKRELEKRVVRPIQAAE